VFPSSYRLRYPVPRRGRMMCAGICAAALVGVAASPAQAALISTGTCDNAPLSQPFRAWGDTNSYRLVPGGDFEDGLAGWTTGGGARTVAGSEPFALTGAPGSSSLSLSPGASVTSPLTCVNASYPALRFLAHNNSLLSTVLVQLVYQDPLLGLVPIPVGIVGLSSKWQPTMRMLTASAVGGALAGGTAHVAIRFTELTGSSTIDDVFLDPRMKA
jgi:hypothetical protein